jgi:hypothetical protein
MISYGSTFMLTAVGSYYLEVLHGSLDRTLLTPNRRSGRLFLLGDAPLTLGLQRLPSRRRMSRIGRLARDGVETPGVGIEVA